MKKAKTLLVLILFALANICYSQDSIFTTQKDTIFTIRNGIGLTLSPLYSMPTMNYGHLIKGAVAGSIGLSGIFRINKKRNIYLSTELGYLNNGAMNKNIPNTTSLISNNGTVNYNNITYYTTITRFNYVYLSLTLQKTIFKFSHGLSLFAGFGAQVNYCYLITNRSKNLVDSNGKNLDYSIKSVSQKYSESIVVNLGIVKNNSKRIFTIVSPQFYYGLQKKNANGFNSVGINLKLLYNF